MQISQILNSMHEGDGFSAKTLWKKPISFANGLFRQWSGRPVLTNGKRPKSRLLFHTIRRPGRSFDADDPHDYKENMLKN